MNYQWAGNRLYSAAASSVLLARVAVMRNNCYLIVCHFSTFLIVCAALCFAAPWFSIELFLFWLLGALFYLYVFIMLFQRYLATKNMRRDLVQVFVSIFIAIAFTLPHHFEELYWWRLDASQEYLLAEAKQLASSPNDQFRFRWIGLLPFHGWYRIGDSIVFHSFNGFFIPLGVAVNLGREDRDAKELNPDNSK